MYRRGDENSFGVNEWSMHAILWPHDFPSRYFGSSIHLGRSRVAVGCPHCFNNGTNPNQGAVYVFDSTPQISFRFVDIELQSFADGSFTVKVPLSAVRSCRTGLELTMDDFSVSFSGIGNMASGISIDWHAEPSQGTNESVYIWRVKLLEEPFDSIVVTVSESPHRVCTGLTAPTEYGNDFTAMERVSFSPVSTLLGVVYPKKGSNFGVTPLELSPPFNVSELFSDLFVVEMLHEVLTKDDHVNRTYGSMTFSNHSKESLHPFFALRRTGLLMILFKIVSWMVTKALLIMVNSSLFVYLEKPFPVPGLMFHPLRISKVFRKELSGAL